MKTTIELYNISKYKNEIYGISILWIMLFHGIAIAGISYSNAFPILSPINNIIQYGNMGVEIFLVCSGICLYFSFVKNNNLLDFLKKRFARRALPVVLIETLYWAWLCFIDSGKLDVAAFLMRITMIRFWITGDAQIWFVSAIMLFYFLYPYIFAALFLPDDESGREYGKNKELTYVYR